VREGRVSAAVSAGGRSMRVRPTKDDSAGASRPRRRQRGSARTTAVILSALAGAALCAGAALLPHSSIMAGLADRRDHFLALTGLQIDEVRVSGQRFTDDGAIFDALDLSTARTLLGFDGAKAAARIERLPWISSVGITRVFPGRLDVTVTERTAYAVWLAGPGQAKLIDQSGRVLQAVPVSQLPALPRLAGEGAPEAARALFEMLAQVPEIGRRVELARRITSRRWSLDLSNGVRLELPPDGEAGALAGLVASPQGARLLASANTVLDLRSRHEIAVRPLEAQAHEP